MPSSSHPSLMHTQPPHTHSPSHTHNLLTHTAPHTRMHARTHTRTHTHTHSPPAPPIPRGPTHLQGELQLLLGGLTGEHPTHHRLARLEARLWVSIDRDTNGHSTVQYQGYCAQDAIQLAYGMECMDTASCSTDGCCTQGTSRANKYWGTRSLTQQVTSSHDIGGHTNVQARHVSLLHTALSIPVMPNLARHTHTLQQEQLVCSSSIHYPPMYHRQLLSSKHLTQSSICNAPQVTPVDLPSHVVEELHYAGGCVYVANETMMNTAWSGMVITG